jgi:hypothetical protein
MIDNAYFGVGRLLDEEIVCDSRSTVDDSIRLAGGLPSSVPVHRAFSHVSPLEIAILE